MTTFKQYDVVYRKRRDKDATLKFVILDGCNIDDIKRKFFKKIQKFDMYANPMFTLVSVNLRKRC